MIEVFCGDPHHGQTVHSSVDRETGVPTRITDVEAAIHQIWDGARLHKAARIWCLGDMFHVNNPASTWQARTIRLYASLLQQYPEIDFYLFDGNHDYNAKPGRENATAALAEALSSFKNFRFFPSYECVTENSADGWEHNYHVVPHGCRLPEGFSPLLNKHCLQRNYLLCHTTFEGAKHGVEETLLADHSRDVGLVRDFDRIFSGHIHKGQDFTYFGQPVHYPGSPERIDFAERAEKKTYTVWERGVSGSNPKGMRVPLHTRPMVQHAIIIDETWDAEAHDWPVVKAALVKILVSVKEEHLALFDPKEVRKILFERGAHYISGFNMQVDRERQVRDSAMTESLTTVEALRRFAKANLPASKRKEKQFINDVIAKGEEILAGVVQCAD